MKRIPVRGSLLFSGIAEQVALKIYPAKMAVMNAPNLHSILVVEDDNALRGLIAELLEIEGYQVSQAANGQEALDILDTISKPCLVLLDMMMPVMNGRVFLDKVMANASLAPIPILVVSAIADRANIKGTIGLMSKPIDTDALLKVVAQYCRC